MCFVIIKIKPESVLLGQQAPPNTLTIGITFGTHRAIVASPLLTRVPASPATTTRKREEEVLRGYRGLPCASRCHRLRGVTAV